MSKKGETNLYGASPHLVALIHGGPGAPGSVCSLAKQLGSDCGVIEPLQAQDSVKGQIRELAEQLESFDHPLTLIGYSWGAMLGILYAAENPQRVKRLILVGCPPLEDQYVSTIMKRRLKHLKKKDRRKVQVLIKKSHNGLLSQDEFDRFGLLMDKADGYKKKVKHGQKKKFQPEIYQKVWAEAEHIRSDRGFIRALNQIKCPIIIIHGRQDPHPFRSIIRACKISKCKFEVFILNRCGHVPWEETFATERFLGIIRALMKDLSI